MRFKNRREAGRLLAEHLGQFKRSDVVVLGLPRGGVPVASEVANELAVPLDVLLVRKLGAPQQHELAAGAIGEDDVRVLNQSVIEAYGLSPEQIDKVEERERKELHRRAAMYRAARAPIDLMGKSVLIVDDGIATGSTALAACRVARARGASWIALVVPVAPMDWEESMDRAADEYIALRTPENFDAVGSFYEEFEQVEDDEVLAILRQQHENIVRPVDSDVSIAIDSEITLKGRLIVPLHSVGCVIFVHGSGSSRKSPRNIHVATILNAAGLATLLFDLLTEDESDSRENIFDIGLLTKRLSEVTKWLRMRTETRGLHFDYFGASTGAAAALSAAAHDDSVVAVVSRGGRPDLAMDDLHMVQCPVLLIVGSKDVDVRLLNEEAAAQLTSQHHVAIVQRASHLFEEPGTLDEAAHLARDFFLEQYAREGAVSSSTRRQREKTRQ